MGPGSVRAISIANGRYIDGIGVTGTGDLRCCRVDDLAIGMAGYGDGRPDIVQQDIIGDIGRGADVGRLIQEMERSIAEAQSFIRSMEG